MHWDRSETFWRNSDAAKWPKGSSDSTKSEGSAEVRYAENSVNNSEVFKTNAAVTNFCPKSRISAFSNSEEQRNNSERLPCRASTVCRAFAGCKRSPKRSIPDQHI